MCSGGFKQSGRPHLASSKPDAMSGSLLGPGFDDEEIAAFLLENHYPFTRYDNAGLYDQVAARLAEGAVVGWFQGRMEFGPRASARARFWAMRAIPRCSAP